MSWRIVPFVCFTILTLEVVGQTADPVSSEAKPAMQAALNTYSKFIGKQAMVYNGVQYAEAERMNEENHPYFLSDYWEEGSVWYDGELYENVFLKWDIWRNELVMEHYNQSGTAANLKGYLPKIRQFTLLGHTFKKVLGDSVNGTQSEFYDVLYEGNTKLVSKRIKRYSENISREGVKPIFTIRDRYYIVLHGVFYPVRGKNSIIKVLKDKKKELNQFSRTEKLQFDERKEEDMASLVRFYDINSTRQK